MIKTIEIFNLGNLPTASLDDFCELQEDFKISDTDKLAKLQMLILTRGFKYAFKAWKDNSGKLWIIDAHQRRKALLMLRKSGFTIPEIPYEPIYAADKKEAVEEIAAYNSEFASKNPDTILFKKYDIDADTLSRFNIPEFKIDPVDFAFGDRLFSQENEESEIQEDDVDIIVPENESQIFVKQHDVWLLGNHRLMCGDCRVSTDVKALMNGHHADICATDPPYNVDYQGGTEDELTIRNDSMEDDLFEVFLTQVFTVMNKVMRQGAPIYVFHADSEGAAFRSAFKKAGFYFAQCCIWLKNAIVMGRQDYQWKHEPCLYGWKPGAAHTWNSDRKQSTIWPFDKPLRSSIHPTMKPIALMAYPIRNSSTPGSICIDFFSGSGSTLMACQQIDRICYAMDIDAKYISATVLRFQTMFPEQPILLLRDGKNLTETETKAIINHVVS
jgi:DNA modification methylase